MTFRSDTTKVNGRESLLTRKADKFRAILSESDNSDDEFKCDSSKKKLSKTSLSDKSSHKKSKLKLGGKGRPQQISADFTNLKPAQARQIEVYSNSKVSEGNTLQTVSRDSSNPEPDLVIDNISSQETVVLSACECTSSQDLTDSDGESCFSSTLLLPNESKDCVFATTRVASVNGNRRGSTDEVGPTRPRLFKRKIVDDEESIVDLKKSKTDTVDPKLPPLCSSDGGDCASVVEIIKEDRSAHGSSPHEISAERESEKATLPIIVDKTQSKVFSPEQVVALSPKQPTANTLDNESRPIKADEKQKKKEISQTLKQQPPKKRLTAAKKQAEQVAKKTSIVAEKCESSTFDSTPLSIRTENSHVHTVNKKEIAPKQDESLPKQRTKAWNPPGRSLGKESTPGSSPSTGRLRLGLSRKRLAKPLHPEIKPKTSHY